MPTVPEDMCCGKMLDDEETVFRKVQEALDDSLPDTALPALADVIAFQLLDCDESDGAFIAFLEELTDKYRFYKEKEEEELTLPVEEETRKLHAACDETMRNDKPAIQAVNEELWWLDFQPRKGSFITEAPSMQDAVRKAWALDCNPGGTVAAYVYPGGVVGSEFRNRLLSWNEADALLKQIQKKSVN
jgi:hypothetical protein